MFKNKIYLDYGATTPIDPKVLSRIENYQKKYFGNPSSLHYFGRIAKEKLDYARSEFKKLLFADKGKIIFTASATESNNLFIKGLAQNSNKKHIIVSPIEHSCVVESINHLKALGYKIDYVKVDQYGSIDIKHLESLINIDTLFVSIIHANNEIGTIQDITQIGKICKQKNVIFHTDASQSFGKIPLNISKSYIDALTCSSHKMYGPKGVGLLYINDNIKLKPLIEGGGQEFNLRSSTENLPLILGFLDASKICIKNMKDESEKHITMRDKIINYCIKNIPNTYLNGHKTMRLPNNINLSFAFIEGEAITMLLDDIGICVSTGSACSSHKLQASHVLKNIKVNPQIIHGSIRITLGRFTQNKDVDFFLSNIKSIIEKLRSMSPFNPY